MLVRHSLSFEVENKPGTTEVVGLNLPGIRFFFKLKYSFPLKYRAIDCLTMFFQFIFLTEQLMALRKRQSFDFMKIFRNFDFFCELPFSNLILGATEITGCLIFFIASAAMPNFFGYKML